MRCTSKGPQQRSAAGNNQQKNASGNSQQQKRRTSGNSKQQTNRTSGNSRNQKKPSGTNSALRQKKKQELMRRKKRRQRKTALLIGVTSVCIAVLFGVGGFFLLHPGNTDKTQVLSYEAAHLNESLYQGAFFAENLCVTPGDMPLEGFPGDPTLHAAGLFDMNNKQVVYADRLFEQIYPASTTKVMTALIVLKYGNLEDIVTVSPNALNLEAEATVCGLQPGDKISLYDLLCGLVLQSGNDNAVAIAEHMSGSVEAFAAKMNEEAKLLGATGSNFVNPHGLHDDNQYMTAYDLYLMFNACLQYDVFKEIISMKSYSSTITYADGGTHTEEWTPTNYYSSGHAAAPEGITVFGGKTGTTNEAGSCVILYSENAAGAPFISLVMGANDKDILYNDMSQLLTAGAVAKAQ